MLLREAIREVGPATSNVQDRHSRFEFNCVRDVVDLIILGFLKRLVAGGVQPRGVHHRFPQGCPEPVVALVVPLVDVVLVMIVRVEQRVAEEILHQVVGLVQTKGGGVLVRFQDVRQVIVAGLDVVLQLGAEGGVLEDLVAADVGVLPRRQHDRGGQGHDEGGNDQGNVNCLGVVCRLGAAGGAQSLLEDQKREDGQDANDVGRILDKKEDELEDVDAEGVIDSHLGREEERGNLMLSSECTTYDGMLVCCVVVVETCRNNYNMEQ
mmetsp:Transcript_57571/g.122143  ORF Transcript_57571/g.122143 Transcript_57571/m.122143 type:complete len:266 (-) Transcript_57571:88-885(-)